MSRVNRRLTSKHTGPAVKRNVRHCPGQKPHRRSRSGCVTSAGLESVRHEVPAPLLYWVGAGMGRMLDTFHPCGVFTST
jgi:hypothetical protein